MKNDEQEVTNLMKGLAGTGVKLGTKYYIFAIPYHFIGTVVSSEDSTITIKDVTIITNAGSATDAVSKILSGKAKPEVSEQPGQPVLVFRQSISAMIPFAK